MKVCVIGAGFGGIAAAVQLKKAGIHDFTLFDRGESVGGTWWWNTYPGAQVDAPSDLYCFSFMPYNWTRAYAFQPEILRYLNAVVDRFELRPHLHLGHRVEDVIWEEAQQAYAVRTDQGPQGYYDVVISGVGLLDVPRWPDWARGSPFEGPTFTPPAGQLMRRSTASELRS
jgi:cation diffusion facilitator CzcD-associated flavoprotein CzcO